MADTSNDSAQEKKEDDRKKINILEEKSKEELIKLVKKYLNLLQKSKNKTDELNKKCIYLEQEKNSAIQTHEFSEKELLDKIDILQHSISELKEARLNPSERDQEIEVLKCNLKDIVDNKNRLTSSLRENEEQLQCISLQLQSLKASCQCIQEENQNLQMLNKEKIEEINVLNFAKDALSSDLNKKIEEYDTLLNIKNDIEEKYENGIDKIHSLQSQIEKLITENELKCQSPDKDVCVLFKENQEYKKIIEDLKKQIEDISKASSKLQTLTETEADNSNLYNIRSETVDILKLKNSNAALEQENLSLSKQSEVLKSELDKCNKQIKKLEEETKKFASICDLRGYKVGIELALLQGASTESLIYPNEQSNEEFTIPQSETSDLNMKTGEMFKNDMYSIGNATGLEYMLLQGADASKLIVSSDEQFNNLPSFQTSEGQFVNTEPLLKNEEVSRYKALFEEKIVEIEKLKKNLVEYSSLYSETLEENQDLKEQLQKFKDKNCVQKKKYLIHEETNTNFEEAKCNEKPDIEKHIKEDGESVEYYKSLCNEIISLCKKFQSERNFSSKPDLSEGDPVRILKHMHKLYVEVISDLKKKCSELDEYNLQLELLVIGIKQGVRQKTSATSYKTENNFEQNMNLLKTLLGELIMRSNSYSSKLKNIETTPSADRKKLEEELIQCKELTQFLEDENRELNNELKKFKCNQSDIEIYNNARFFGEAYQQSPELYSIEESNEFEDRLDVSVNLISTDKIDKEYPHTTDISVQTFHSVKDSAIQIESDLFSQQENTELTENAEAFVQTDLKEENHQIIIEELKQKNESLKKLVCEKNNLVENIHCQMDSLLTKVEELSAELQRKEDDLKQAQCLNVDLKRMLTEVQNIKCQQNNALRISQNLIHEFKVKNENLNADIRSFTLNYQELMTNMNNSIINVITENCKDFSHLEEMCIHKEKSFTIIKQWIIEFTEDFECWFNFMNQMKDETLMLDMSQLERFNQSSSQTFSLIEATCNEDACCLILEDISNLNSCKLKLFSRFYNYLNSDHNSLVNTLHNYKVNVIPNIEKKLVELEKKIADCTCQDKEIKVYVDAQEKNSEESLKKMLAETENKMNKFKQIALKLKKELAQTKEQYNDVNTEKEKLQKQNVKFLEELNKISEDQCKYVQNYQSLQNEFDKLQDDCEMHKLNTKKLEEGLASKLHELTSSKEQVMELESQLRSSKQLIESNLSLKKELDMKCADLESKVIVLESKINEKEQKINSMATDISKHLKDLNIAWEDNKNLKDRLELAQKEGNKKNLLDLEMADYEKSITELNSKIQRKEDEIEELQSEIKSLKERYDCLQEEIKSTETLKETEAKRAESLKEILEKTKTELNKVKEHETELLSKTASFEVLFETMTQQEEYFKLQLSENLSQIQHLQDVIKASSENHQRIVRSFEQKISNQKEEILLAHKEVESVKQEFENYKIRVHSVLKQQKTVTPPITTIDADLKEKLETMNEKLKLQVKDLSEKETALSLEYKTLQEEHDSLLQRYNKLIDDREQKDKEWHQRLELVNAEKNRLRATQEELSSQHLLQNEMLVATYKKQIKIMSEEHKRIVNDLQNQLDAADVEIARLQRDQQKLQGLPITPVPQDNSTSFDILSQERQEGEGSESTDETTTPIRHLSLATIPSSGFLPFEKLIQSPLESGTPSSFISNADSEKLSTDLNTANKKIDHLSELLNDSESTNLRLSEQVRVLKDEVRRLENNKEREQHAENLEYLKNVFIKFACLQPGSEKVMLIPVLTTMLKLSPNEQYQLKSVAGDFESADNTSSGWGSYLHRWSGLS